jgi:HSP20 family molecular chaperone IbpA
MSLNQKKPSLLERLTGGMNDNTYDDMFEEERLATPVPQPHAAPPGKSAPAGQDDWNEEEMGELAVDVYQTPSHVVIKALVAGVVPANVDISLSRDTLTVRGTREDEREVQDENYFQKELYWGSFSRTILLPEEVDVDQAEAYEKHGILIIRLPKINKAKQTKLKVRSR